MFHEDKRSAAPVVLAHAACSGGSVIYRALVATFGWVGLSEVGHVWKLLPTEFRPHDPVSQLYSSDVISTSEFEELYLQRLEYCRAAVARQGQRLLIREHTHSYYFSVEDSPKSAPSWIQTTRFGNKFPCLVTVRDPIDSWLGLQTHFSTRFSGNFHDYCARYHLFLDATENSLNSKLLKYESFVSDQQAFVDNVSRFLEIEPMRAQGGASVASTGNSGRRTAEISSRKRRPFLRSWAREVLESEEYRHLASRLGYALIDPQDGFTSIGMSLQSGLSRFYRVWRRLVS